ncbi:MAG: hypothetical protein PUB58_08235, partial [Clostridiales bacterium]|nr:hypothetical protein [Clostridiales bacterium]
RRRADSIRPFEDFLGGQMASPLAEHIQNRPRVSAHPLAHLRFSLPSMIQFYYMIFILICQFFSSVSEGSLPVFCQANLDILLKTMDKSQKCGIMCLKNFINISEFCSLEVIPFEASVDVKITKTGGMNHA